MALIEKTLFGHCTQALESDVRLVLPSRSEDGNLYQAGECSGYEYPKYLKDYEKYSSTDEAPIFAEHISLASDRALLERLRLHNAERSANGSAHF